MQDLNFVAYDEEFLKLSWIWLNDPEIKALTNTPDFTKEGQRSWFATLPHKTDYKVWGIESSRQRIGVMGLKNIDDASAEYFGYIGDKAYWNKGLSRQMLAYALSVGEHLGLERIWLKVIKNNPRAIKAYEKFGFCVFRETDTEKFMEIILTAK